MEETQAWNEARLGSLPWYLGHILVPRQQAAPALPAPRRRHRQPSSSGVLPTTLVPAACAHSTALRPRPPKSRCSGTARGSKPATRRERGTEGLLRRRRCAEGAGPRSAPRPRARNQTRASGRTSSAASRWVLSVPRHIQPGRPPPDAPHSSPAAGQGASAAAAGDAAGAASAAAAGRAPRPHQGRPLPVSAPVPVSHWPPPS